MENHIRGKVYVVGDNIDTDQIIPAKYLSYNPADPEERKYFGRYAMAGVPEAQAGLPQGNVAFTAPDAFESEFKVIVGGSNFGCGSSREHAPLALAVAGCHVIIATGYARIFFRNCVNGGYCAPMVSDESLVGAFKTGQEVEVDIFGGYIRNLETGEEYKLQPLGDVAAIVDAGGLFEFARETGMLKK